MLVPADGMFDPIPGVRLRRVSTPTEVGHGVSFPCFCQVAQGRKELRLQEAHRLMLSGEFDATTAGNRVGYDDTSQFSREYKRLFGQPPLRDVAQLRAAPMDVATV